jgi:hypothetical protein
MRRGVEIADAVRPGRLQDAVGLGICNGLKQISDPGTAKSHLRNDNPGAANVLAHAQRPIQPPSTSITCPFI